MLRTCTPGPAPHLRAPSPTEGLRRQIVDMVRITDYGQGQRSATIIYDLRQRQVVQGDTTRGKTPDIRRITARNRPGDFGHDLDTSKSSGSFPQPCKTSTPCIQRRETKRVTEVRNLSPNRFKIPSPPRTSQGVPETTKRPRTGQGRGRRVVRTKSIRLQNDTAGPHCQSSDSSSPSDEKTTSKTSGEPCEVRGNAISTSPARPRVMSPVKRAEVQRRATLFSTSLELFRRRLKMNQSKFFSCNKVNPEEYVIRKDERKPSAKQRLNVNNIQNSNKPSSPVRVAQTQLEDSADDRLETKQTRCSYRLPELTDEEKQVTFGDLRSLPQVQTYVLEDDGTDQVRRRTFKEPAPLTSHNLGIHNMFMDQQRRRPRVEANGVIYDARTWRWVEESNAQGRVQRMVRFNITSNPVTETVPMSDSSRVVSDGSRD
ncbi:uncharacterized protein LOC124145679 [Haliotis rufescens]|uniref:uncharacterized protein LOC124145679 n=1 Tax=Haliotis rufescens TaxID=6454 RepID=UPI00201E80D7|nr:uncharacterized protein LOC124145679 [Haliotis rufescens]XP_046371513.2 uncharacterized protein LOC124145679 [Haliotis rufescens]XP_046371514.2 uncharacterized protein LOC124145679 [Haliotis rufescens]